MDEEEELQNGDIRIDLCKTCGSGGELIVCDKCVSYYHIECCEPPLRRVPRAPWLCSSCKEFKDSRDRHRNTDNGKVVQCTGLVNNQRRCAAKARYKIHNFAKFLRGTSDSDDSGDEIITSRRSHRREDGRDDLPLHNAALQELLADVMKHKDAWPFVRPVQKNEVPDYYDVISKPMDFGTIKYKLNMGEYNEDSKLMQDAVLVFENCNTYNDTDADVYKCGVRLLKYFEKKAKELGLKLPEEMESEEQPKTKKRRTK
ncbi:hypothetical protein NQ318_018647 [Aromia moschata]|uniref:Uncharacterized protein n=1 Tax=Aromia moschata TaxID=1265417 RepID=A0AAV8ZIM2_9CUCU|nr:hypothetical protein NQ318_018647 [Aromia moschata]